MSERKSRFVFLAIATVMCLYIFLDSQKLSFKNSIYVTVMFVIFITMTVWEVLAEMRTVQREKKEAVPEKEGSSEDTKEAKEPFYKNKKLILVAAMLLFVALMSIFGFFVAALVSYIFLTFLLGTRNPVQLLVIPVITLALIYVIFVMLFNIRLPQGLLF